MNKQEIIEWLEMEIEGYPARATGNECEDHIVTLAGRLVDSDRENFVEAMRCWITEYSNRTLMATKIAAEHKLHELKPEIEKLLKDVRSGSAFLPYYEEIIAPALNKLCF